MVKRSGVVVQVLLALLYFNSLCASTLVELECRHSVQRSELELGWEGVHSSHPFRSSLTANITSAEQAYLSQVAKAPWLITKLKFATAMRSGKWGHRIFDRKDSPNIAYAVYLEGGISQAQLATHQLRWAAKKEFGNATPIPLFIRNKVNPLAEQILTAGAQGLDPTQATTFFKQARALPKSEQFLWQIARYPTLDETPKLGIADATFFTVMEMRFCAQSNQSTGSKPLIVPSFSLMQLQLDTIYEDKSVTMIPEFGVATSQSLANQIANHTRAFVVPFPGIEGVVEGDGMYFGMLYASIHDYYHAYRGSANVNPAYAAILSRIFQLTLQFENNRFPELTGMQPISGIHHELWEDWRGRWTDFEPLSRQLYGFGYGGNPGIMDAFRHDFSTGSDYAITQLVVFDMARNPEAWRALGVEPTEFAPRLGEKARTDYQRWLR